MGEVIGKEKRVVKRDLSEQEIERLEAQMEAGFAKQREAESLFTAFRKFAEPRIKATIDPYYKKDDDDRDTLKLGSIEEARGLNDELEHMRKLRASKVAFIRAERRVQMDAVANGYVYETVECELVMDIDRLIVQTVAPGTNAVIDTRAMTAEERQMHLPGTNGSKGAPATVQ